MLLCCLCGRMWFCIFVAGRLSSTKHATLIQNSGVAAGERLAEMDGRIGFSGTRAFERRRSFRFVTPLSFRQFWMVLQKSAEGRARKSESRKPNAGSRERWGNYFPSIFSRARRRAPLLTLWGNIRAAAGRAVRWKSLRVLLFCERVAGGEARFIFFRTCVFRDEEQLVCGGPARRVSMRCV